MKKGFLMMFLLCALVLTGCSDTGSSSETSSQSSVSDTVPAETEKATSENVSVNPDAVGVWSYNKELLFYAKDGTRYNLTESPDGSAKDKDGKTYSVQECQSRLYEIINTEDEKLTLKEGRYSEERLNSRDYPDGYKTMVVTYQKTDLFDPADLEALVSGADFTPDETASEQVTETKATTEIMTEAVTEAPTTEAPTEPPTEEITTEAVTEPETTEASQETQTAVSDEEIQNSEYAYLYDKVQAFLDTDNFIQKDPGNRALELFNYLHNLADSNIQESSITNDTANQTVKFKCFDKYVISVNVAESEITVTEE